MPKRVRKFAIVLVLFLPACLFASFDHSDWDKLLKKHVKTIDAGVATQVDYSGMATDRVLLSTYLASISSVQRESFDSWSRPSQLAFLINTYNAWVGARILLNSPPAVGCPEGAGVRVKYP